MQKPEPGEAAASGSSLSEDCLVPGLDSRGGFVNGVPSAAIFHGTNFVKQGLVFVSFNYRLGRFGFSCARGAYERKRRPAGKLRLSG